MAQVTHVLDTSALLAHAFQEPGWERVREILRDAAAVLGLAAAVNVDGVGVRPFGDLSLVFKVGNRAADDAAVGGVEHDELVGVKPVRMFFSFAKAPQR